MVLLKLKQFWFGFACWGFRSSGYRCSGEWWLQDSGLRGLKVGFQGFRSWARVLPRASDTDRKRGAYVLEESSQRPWGSCAERYHWRIVRSCRSSKLFALYTLTATESRDLNGARISFEKETLHQGSHTLKRHAKKPKKNADNFQRLLRRWVLLAIALMLVEMVLRDNISQEFHGQTCLKPFRILPSIVWF